MSQLSFLPLEQQTVCQLLGRALFHRDYLPEQNVDWDAVYEESVRQAVAPLTFLQYQQLPLHDELKGKVKTAIDSCIYQYIQNCTYHSYLDFLMRENDIAYVVLKGVSSALYYPQPELRQMGDVDFLIHRDEVERATEVLRQDGFQPWEEEHICHIVFRREKMHYEMHFEPAGVPNGQAGEIIRSYLEDVQSASQYVQDGTFSYRIPDKFHHGLIMLLHMQHHLLAEGIGLRHLCDWAVFVHSFSEDDFIRIFQEKMKRAGLWQFAKIISLTAHLAFGMAYQKWMGKDRALAAALLQDILSGGNFGSKDQQRMYEGMFISNRGKDGIRRTRIGQFVLSLNQVVYTHWPLSRRVKILLPPGWLFFGIRQMLRIAAGKRSNIDFLGAYRKSAGRKSVYKRLRLFETEGKNDGNKN